MGLLLDAEAFISMLRGGTAVLNENRQIVNDLNVFPVPDGDTGDNMYMTISSGFESAAGDTISEATQSARRAMLRGARGNSGVILSQIFAGFSKGMENVVVASNDDIVRATNISVEEAYGAVTNPVNGTILSVYRDAVNFANSKIDECDSVSEYISYFLNEAEASLERTPDQLPALKQAGVVDSGGAGLIYIFSGMKDALDGKKFSLERRAEAKEKPLDLSLFNENSELLYGYCTEFLLCLSARKVDVGTFGETIIKNYLTEVGESVVFFRDGNIIKVHVHTKTPGEILNYCQKYGEFLTIKIENMALEHSQTETKNAYVPPKKKQKNGIVSVGAGDGVKNLFTDMGVDVVVNGGQTMNPSAEDFINAYKQINADRIFVFPNNPNIILAANQSAELFKETEVIVIPTRSLGEGYMGISGLDRDSDSKEEILEAVADAMEGVVTLIVSKASRTTTANGVEVVAGDYIGYEGKTIYSDSPDKNIAAEELLEKTGAEKFGICLKINGKDVTKEESESLSALFESKYKRTELIEIEGGQPLYDYIMILQ